MAKVQISIDDDLLKKIDAYADENYLSRSGFISIASAQYLQAQGMYMHIKDLSVSMRRIADTGEIDDETLNSLRQFEYFVKSIHATK